MGEEGEERQGETGADQDSHVSHGTTGGVCSVTAVSSTFAHDVSVCIRSPPAGADVRQIRNYSVRESERASRS